MNTHRKEVAQQVGIGALVTLGIVASGLVGCVLWVLAMVVVG